MVRKRKTYKEIFSAKNPKQPELLPTWESLAKAVTDVELYLNFAKSYLHNFHLQGATDALKSIKRVSTQGLKNKKGELK